MTSPGAGSGGGEAARAPGDDWVYVGLGGNLGTDEAIVRRFDAAIGELAARAAAGGVVCASPIYRSAPVGPVVNQPAFLNQVVAFPPAPGLDPHGLLALLQGIESRHGRTRDVPQGPRTLDLDLLLFGQRVIVTPDLIVPHPRLGHRPFVLRPLLDLRGDRLILYSPGPR